MRLLEAYDWPGNVRQLENLIERAIALSGEAVITARDIPLEIIRGSSVSDDAVSLPVDGLELEEYLTGLRRQLMSQALDRSDGVQTKAAELLRISFRSFRYYAKKLGLSNGDASEIAEASERSSAANGRSR
jgi:two-component system response regulator PilR (NtrC family)